jgi:hypothetical protein
MAKRRKRTNSNIPAKGRLRDMADQLWSLAVKDDWGHKCAMCGRGSGLNSHHLIPRQHMATRHDLANGICLCNHCHQFDGDRSPHQNAAGFVLWLKSHHPMVAEWYEDMADSRAYKEFSGTTNAAFWCETLRRVKEYVPEEDYRRICGAKFSEWLDSQP